MKLISVGAAYLLGIITEDGTAVGLSCIYRITLTEALESPFYGILGMIISKMVLLVMVLVLERIILWSRRSEAKTTVPYWAAIFLIPLGSAFVLHTIFVDLLNNPDQSPYANALAIVALLLINGLVFYLYHRIMESEQVKYEQAAYIRKSKAVMAEIALTKAFQENIRTLRHDMKNHFTALLSLAQQGDSTGIATYINSLDQSLETAKAPVNSGNAVIDGILNRSLYIASQSNIVCDLTLKISGKIVVDDQDITIILGNLLDNAIEASQQVPEDQRKIAIKLVYDKSMMLITVTNPYLKKALQERKGLLSTSKRVADRHGYGLKNIERSVKKYRGLFEYRYDEPLSTDLNSFVARVHIYL